MTDQPRPDDDAMDVDEDVDNTQIQQPEVDDYGIEVDFEELEEDLRNELLDMLTNDDSDDDKVQSALLSSLKAAEARLTETITRLDTDISKATPNMRAGERLAATEERLAAVDAEFAATRKRAVVAKKAFEDVLQTRRADV